MVVIVVVLNAERVWESSVFRTLNVSPEHLVQVDTIVDDEPFFVDVHSV